MNDVSELLRIQQDGFEGMRLAYEARIAEIREEHAYELWKATPWYRWRKQERTWRQYLAAERAVDAANEAFEANVKAGRT